MDASKMKKSGGYTLVEVMVAMVISLIVLGGVYRAITDETVNLARDEAVLDMQNNARVAIARIAGDIRRAGFFGCGGKLSANTASHPYPPTAIVFTNNDTATSNIDDGTDTITLAFLAGDVPLKPGSVDDSTSSSAAFTLARKAFVSGEPLLITDCEEFAIFKKTNPTDNTLLLEHNTSLNSSADLKRVYGAPQPSRVYSFASSAYRVDGADLKLNDQKIAANIEDLQFEFVEDTNHDKVYDEPWSQTFANAADVRFIRVWVLAMSDPVYTYTDTNTYDYPNSPYHSGAGGSPASQVALANDKKHCYRYLASAVVYVRNLGII